MGNVNRRNLRHGHARETTGKSAEYRAWEGMHARCYRPKNREFKNYGARGIEVCMRWHVFDNFLADMGLKPSSRHSMDRIDGSQNYGPGNCRWATAAEQLRNTRRNVWLTHAGETMCLQDWANRLGVSKSVLRGRIRAGYATADVLAPRGAHAKRRATGERASKAKLTMRQVLEARALYATGSVSGREIGRRLGISSSAVAKMLSGRTWTAAGLDAEAREAARKGAK